MEGNKNENDVKVKVYLNKYKAAEISQVVELSVLYGLDGGEIYI
jgi:hypothetical protein